MSKQERLTPEEMEYLGTIEKNLRTAVDARWVSHLSASSVDRMLEIWKRLTGQARPYSRSCGTCALHLAIDLGTLYFAQKPQKPQKTAKSAPNAPKGNKGTAKGGKGKGAKNNK